MAIPAHSTIRRKPPATEPARWSKFHPACYAELLNHDIALCDVMLKRGIRLAGVDYQERQFLAGTPCSETHLIWVIFSGRVECDAGAGFRPMKQGDMAICRAGQPQWIRLASPKATGLWLHLTPSRHWERLAGVVPGVYSDLALGHLRGLLEAYLLNLPSHGAVDLSTKIHALELLLFSLEQALDQIIGVKRHAFRTRIKALETRIQASLQAVWTVAAMAAELNMSPGYLHKELVRHLGIKPMGLVTKLRMNQAMNQLVQTNMTLAAIAEEVGFASPFAFSTAFKREVGCSPARFRAEAFGTRETGGP